VESFQENAYGNLLAGGYRERPIDVMDSKALCLKVIGKCEEWFSAVKALNRVSMTSSKLFSRLKRRWNPLP
jgi:hypothetical protein